MSELHLLCQSSVEIDSPAKRHMIAVAYGVVVWLTRRERGANFIFIIVPRGWDLEIKGEL